MAENKQDRTTFKWGDLEYLLDDLLRLHAEQEQKFYRFAQDLGKYAGDALEGLRNAVRARIGAVKSGQSFEGDGVLPTDTPDNTTVQIRDKKLFRKALYGEQDNTEWAKYYLNKLVGQLTPYEKPVDPKTVWSMELGGFGAFLVKSEHLNAQEIFENYDKRRPNDNSNNKPTTARFALLKQYLKSYEQWLQKKNFDYTGNDNEFDDLQLAMVTALIENFEKACQNPEALKTALRKIGAGDDFAIAFTSTKFNLDKSDEQIQQENEAREAERKQAEIDSHYDMYVRAMYNKYLNSNPRTGLIQKYEHTGNDFYFDEGEFDAYNLKISGDETVTSRHWDNLDTTFNKNPFADPKVAAIVLPFRLFRGLLLEITDGKYAGWLYDKNSINDQNNSVIAVDPVSGKYKEIFVGDIPGKMDEIKHDFLVLKKVIDPVLAYLRADGGVLTRQTGGTISPSAWVRDYYKLKNAEKAKATGNTEEVQKARDRIVSNGDDSFTSEKASVYDPDAGFTSAEKVRLGSILADITSIFLDPVSGAVVGAGSSLANLYSDIADDGFLWGDLGNLAINLGLDVVGMIPILGDAVGTGTKITRKLVKYGPRFLAFLAASSGIANAGGMKNSWEKLLSEDKSQKLTVQDWRNIAQSITLIAGGTQAVKGKVAQKKMQKATKVENAVGVRIVNNKTGEINQVLLDGNKAKSVVEAKGNAKAIADLLDDLPDFKGQFSDGTFSVNTVGRSWQLPFGKKVAVENNKKEWGWRGFRDDGVADVTAVYDLNKAPLGYGKSVLPFVRNAHTAMIRRLNNGNEHAIDLRANQAALTDAAVAQAKRVGRAVGNRELRDLQLYLGKKQQADLEAQVGKGNQKEIETLLENIEFNKELIAEYENTIKTAREKKQDLNKSLSSVKGSDRNRLNDQISKQDDIIARNTKLLDREKATLRNYERRLADMPDLSKLADELGSVQKAVAHKEAVHKRVSKDSGNHTMQYKKLQELIDSYKKDYSVIGGKKMNWDINEIFKAAGLDPKKMYKAGGPIDKNKLTKFLKYALG